jgi:hypothetical protein
MTLRTLWILFQLASLTGHGYTMGALGASGKFNIALDPS